MQRFIVTKSLEVHDPKTGKPISVPIRGYYQGPGTPSITAEHRRINKHRRQLAARDLLRDPEKPYLRTHAIGPTDLPRTRRALLRHNANTLAKMVKKSRRPQAVAMRRAQKMKEAA